MRSVKKDGDDDDDEQLTDAREIIFKKSNYGPLAETIKLEWRDGMFLPKRSLLSSVDQAAEDARAESLFMDLLRRFESEGRTVGHKKGPSYAPALFAVTPEAKSAGLNSKRFEKVMEQLFQRQAIGVEQYGRPSRLSHRIVLR